MQNNYILKRKMSFTKYIKKYALNKFFQSEDQENFVVHLCPAVTSDNVGDFIIADAVSKELAKLFPQAYIGTYPCKTPLHSPAVYRCNQACFRFVGGTNILQGKKPQRTWAVPFSDLWKYRKAILMGAGWGKYQKKISLSSRMFYRSLLDNSFLHSVRDSYTCDQLKKCGIENVICTGCPTTWNLTESFCSQIPAGKKSSAVVTLTDYAKDPERDQALLNACAANYENLFFFPQSSADIPYFHAVLPAELAGKFIVIAPDLAEYDRFLTEIQPDFIGTRLHGGIRALQHRCRVLIIGIDNRAKEMGKDISLPFLPQENMKELPGLLQNGWDIALKIPQKNIDIWKDQFRKNPAPESI